MANLTMLITSSIKGSGYGSLLMATFNFLKLTQTFSLPFFLSTITIGDNWVASSTCLMKHVVNILSMSCLIMDA
jgi:hypothetical protein